MINSRSKAKTLTTWRRHECRQCHSVVTSHEQIDLNQALRVANRQKRYEPFQRDKLFLSLHRSLQHRKTGLEDATALTDTVIGQVLHMHTNGIIGIKTIRDCALKSLKRFDKAAATYYAVGHQNDRYS